MEERREDRIGYVHVTQEEGMAAGARGAARGEREGKGGGRNREVGGVEGGDQARPATMTSRAFKRE